MESIIPIISIATIVLVIGVVKFRDYKKHKANPVKKWEGKSDREMKAEKQDAENKAETQKGIGRAGGPFGGGSGGI
ncbi:hypothetical protein IMZ31_17105 [Pontibacillus sp. ALD_SL1]|uniref:hypothetical protein n=1 Tax=Pontibacillus sp. ALD_SL1 TaxID=2777185 RepID=UPI001A959301|nr:hypothetical protein [Pontibacillus sp. ALD_SL1]QSS99760.1 hypothetical protein IMZ31_17105 [Pontibacillus sp. ALD_SL1]